MEHLRKHCCVRPNGEAAAAKPEPARADRWRAAPLAASPILARRRESALLDINRATAGELETIHGLGPVLVRRIIESRPFRSLDAVQGVKGVGEKRMEQVRLRCCVRPDGEATSARSGKRF